MLVTNTTSLGRSTYACYKLDQIVSVRAVRIGKKKSKTYDTTRYVLKIFLNNGKALRVLSTKDSLRVKKELLCLRRFLQIELEAPISV